MSTDDGHKVYFSGKEDRHEYGVGLLRIRTPISHPAKADAIKMRIFLRHNGFCGGGGGGEGGLT